MAAVRRAGLSRTAALVLMLALALLVLCPMPLAAADRGFARSAESSPAESAITGGVARLQAPRSTMIKVRASTFAMGSTIPEILEAVADCAREPLGHRCKEELFSDELNRHSVTLSSYWLDRTEVTVESYARCVSLRRCRPIPFADGARRFERPRYPATLVSWEDARNYCRFRGARLPTEAEFERAARGLSGRRYPWGQLYNSRAANHGRLGLDATDDIDGFVELAPVGSFPAGRTPDGFMDLAGNAAEWVQDRYAPGYTEEAARNPQGPGAGAGTGARVVRGGHFASAAPWLRSAARQSADPTARQPNLGFRCARSEPHVQVSP